MKYAALLTALLVASLTNAQPLGSDWNQTSADRGRYVEGGFLPDGKVIVHQLEASTSKVICLDPSNGPGWTVAVNGRVQHMLVTTDGFVYVTVKPDNNKPFVLALDSATGSSAWQHTVEVETAQLYEMRIFGGSLLVGGQTSDPILLSLNRVSGSLIYAKAYPSSTESGISTLRANSQFLFVNLNGGLSKIDPATGDVLAARPSVIFDDFQVDSASNVFVGRGPNGTSDLRRFNFSSSGPVPDPVFTSPNQGIRSMMLAGGFVYGAFQNRLVKYRPSDGSVVWTRELEGSYYVDSFPAIKADTWGRIHVISQVQDWEEFSSGQVEYIGGWTYRILDPLTGLDLSSRAIASTTHITLSLVVGYALYLNVHGEALLLGTRAQYWKESGWGPFYRTYGYAVIAYQTPVPQPELYTVAENELFSSAGNGVLKNDRFVNPSETTATLISPPSQGTLTMLTNGEFAYDATGVPPGDYTFIYEASRGELSGTVTSTIRVARGLLSLSLTRNTLAGQNATLGTVTMSSAGAASPVTISDDSSLVTTPSSVTVPAGQTTATFGVQVVPVTSQHVITVRASNGGFTRTAPLTLVPLIPTAMAFTPGSTVVGGTTVNCRVVMNGVAGPGGRVVSIYDNNIYSAVPNQVTVPPGASQVIFAIQTTHPNTLQVSRITAAVTAGSVSANLRITP